MHVITQPYKRPRNAAEDNYLVTLAEEFDLVSAVKKSGKNIDLSEFLSAHPSGKAKIWAVGISRPALRAREKISVGDLVLFYGDGAVYAYGTVSARVHWPQNNSIWPSGNDWDHIYSLSEFVYLPEGQRLAYQALRNLTDKLDVYSVGCRDIESFGTTRDELIRYVTHDGPRYGETITRPGIPEGITKEDIRTALTQLRQSGIPTGFGERTEWVLDDDGTWFPPKAVIAVAATRLLGRTLKASEFSGGEGSGQANRVLRELGFTVLRRNGSGIQQDPITDWIAGLQETRRATINGTSAPHQPTTILWLLSEFLKGQPRLQKWSSIQEALANLIVDAGGGPTPEFPLAVLANEHLIEVNGLPLPLSSTSSAPRRVFNEHNPQFGLPETVYKELGSQPDRITEILTTLKNLLPNQSIFDQLAQKLHLPRQSEPSNTQLQVAPQGENAPGRKARTSYSIQRSTEVAKWVKQTYDNTCQVCGTRLQTPTGATSDAAHIQALGSPHDGPDVIENILCLCPNHHRTFDAGAWTLSDQLIVIDCISGETGEKIQIHPSHTIHLEHVQYHRFHFVEKTKER
jgi:hypothetical protein